MASNKEARVESRFYSNCNGKVLEGLIWEVSPSYLFALVAGVSGLIVSYVWGASAGAAISLVLALIFAVTFCLRKVRS